MTPRPRKPRRPKYSWSPPANSLTSKTEIPVCAACHSRRSQPFEYDRTGQPLMDSFLPATLDDGLYHVDG
ncbi:doubled CXXCH domain-containing protein [Alcanivorax sp. MD8A]|uniref:hypothetical protein n=1 Tax=Alcanivorax sp. MD8A TaxID=1177157 RepID=UPI000C9B7671|nr:hypothetical protein [Alcanivorax sp. MD8A]PNE02396.1 doubled CXXCH domain-containing protein [Alcanivorax sp. MD8A]